MALVCRRCISTWLTVLPLLAACLPITLGAGLISRAEEAMSNRDVSRSSQASASLPLARQLAFREREQRLREQTWHQELRERGEKRRSEKRERWRALPSPAATDPVDKQALIALYHSTKGSGWTNNKGWVNGSSSDPCSDQWAGVYCSSAGRVLSVELVYNNMQGPLPSELGRLEKVQQLVFYSNMLTGEIPSSIFDLPNLQEFDVNNNQLTGRLPSELRSPALQHLVLYTNQLTGALPTTWSTPRLLTAELSSNTFTGQPPTALGELTKLQEVVVSRNNLTGEFPSSWGSLHNLSMLWTFNNEMKGPLPSSWEALRALENVEMDGVSGELPEFVGSWNKLTLLIIVRGTLSGSIPSSLCHLRRVQTLWLFGNSLSGELPSCLGDLQSVQQLELSDNQLTGSVPESAGQLRDIQYFYLSRNLLSGKLPSSLSGLSHLQILDFSSNQIVGTIPTSFNSLQSHLVDLALCYNKFAGPFDSSLEPFFKAIGQYTCALYGNPWQCPIPSFVPKECGCSCSQCNSQTNRDSCEKCVSSSDCGWCAEGPNCLQGSASGPGEYKCAQADWHFGNSTHCSNHHHIRTKIVY